MKLWPFILTILCTSIFFHRLHILQRLNNSFEIIPYNYFDFRRYPNTKISNHFIDADNQVEQLYLYNDPLPNGTVAEIHVKKNRFSDDEQRMLSGVEKTIDGKSGMFTITRKIGGGSRSNTYEYFSYNFVFKSNDYYYFCIISNRNIYLLNDLLTELIEDIDSTAN